MSADSSAGFERRFIQVNFDKPIDRDGIEFNFQEKFRSEMSGILNWALVGYRRLKERGRFIHTERSKQATDDFKKHRAQVETFLKSGILREFPHQEENGEITRLCVWMEDIYDSYLEWCAQEDVVPFYKEKSPFARELFTKKPDWRVRKKRERVNDEIRDSRLYGIQIMENLVST
jgi:phage/plasmid-associated DNA primase